MDGFTFGLAMCHEGVHGVIVQLVKMRVARAMKPWIGGVKPYSGAAVRCIGVWPIEVDVATGERAGQCSRGIGINTRVEQTDPGAVLREGIVRIGIEGGVTRQRQAPAPLPPKHHHGPAKPQTMSQLV